MDPRRRNIIVIAVVVVLVAAGIGGYFALRSSSVTATCGGSERTTICVDQAELPDTLDPQVTFSTPGWAAVQQVYQGLVQYNGSSVTTFTGELAKNWSEFSNNLTGFDSWVFHLYSGAHFSNGDPYNAYVQWYSFYRSLLLAQGPQFILEQNFYSTNFDTSLPLNYTSPALDDAKANATLAGYLNSWNFGDPTQSEIALMEEPYQSFQVVDNLTIQLNLGYGYLASNYTYLLASISAPNSCAVDPAWVDANGGVTPGAVNDYLTTHSLGTGQYLLENYAPVSGGGYDLVVNPNYWGKAAAAAEPWDNNLQPANTTVDVIFQQTIDVTISDLIHGKVAEASFAYTGPSTIKDLLGYSNVVVDALPTVVGSTSGSWWLYLNQSASFPGISGVNPLSNLSVREAIAHAINYNDIIQHAFGGYAQQWVGPVPPAYPYDNNATAKLPFYQYNLTLAKQEIADSPCANGACAGKTLNYEFLDLGDDWAEMAQDLVHNLSAIGITISPVELSLPVLYDEQSLNSAGVCISATKANGGPFPMGQEFYTSDYVSPDDWTQNDASATGSANMCMAGYNNQTVTNLTYKAAGESNPANLTRDYTTMETLIYYNYSEIWTVVPTSFAVYTTNLHGVIINAMGSAEPYQLLFNTQWLS
ncbi:MAG TPA: ABC transporter substrate-binding protein [Thermoplasmata archaeon]|jgi:peptide/nickel transport system substrate-binding protein|nr:ABC transporter substrate-binding protein [Thermoplasmata archaeon]